MKRTSVILAAMLSASALATLPAAAAGGTANAGGGTSTQGTGSMDNGGSSGSGATSTTNSAESKDSMGMSAGSMADMSKSLQTADIKSVTVVKTSDMANTDKNAAGTVNTDTTAEEQQQLQTALQANSNAASMLKEQGVDISSVVAANLGANGTLTVYVQ